MVSEEKQPTIWINADSAINACRQQLRVCETTNKWYRDRNDDHQETEEFGDQKKYLAHTLFQAHLRILLLIEESKIPMYRETYLQGFKSFKNLATVIHWSEDQDVLYSKPLIYIEQHFEALQSMVLQNQVTQVSALSIFERILNHTPYILADADITPTNESQVRNALYNVLKLVFPDMRREIPIAHVIKQYKADLGSSALKTLVEVKYALDEKELRSQIDGVFADMKGYAGNPSQWNKFYALFYTAKPVTSPERMLAHFEGVEASIDWTPIIVHGPGIRKSKLSYTSTPESPAAQSGPHKKRKKEA
ncbi:MULTISPECIES: hypothetical protein [Rhizobium]|uniref:Conserved protein n=1 Tax=Rhizobium favelukesii TaxID=348824 RepID=W6RGB6_9HYPH|nr:MULTISPECIES: hypothetical protein [Rhizobium]MCS0460407.1 hypothetical protein [Rhizobium favelukesii]UFS80790.1 hypothetical protein LPB79_20755 [Rhizobium sp. T136]CDM57753.1 putative conserved protein [Rhizobium favelukesii]